jgi:hypothetical protein
MKQRLILATLSLVSLLLASCASGPSFAEAQASMPQLAKGQGRLFVYRTATLGAAVQPAVKVNGNVIGKAKPKGFLYADLPVGSHTVETATEVTRSTTASVSAGASTYVRLNIGMGVVTARVTPEVVPASVGAAQVATCKLAK